jgi:hypothetical protein
MNGTAQISERIESDPLAKTIVSMINAMEADYGQTFIKQFRDAEVLKNYKRRLYQKLKGLPIEAVVNGYELCAERNTKFCPTVPGIVESVLEAVKRNKKLEVNKLEAESVAALPPPTIICNPLELLAKAKTASKTGSKENKAEWMARKAEALKNHETVLNLHGHKIKRLYAQPEHSCVVNGCHHAGTLSGGIKGGGNWYCIKHFKTAG